MNENAAQKSIFKQHQPQMHSSSGFTDTNDFIKKQYGTVKPLNHQERKQQEMEVRYF